MKKLTLLIVLAALVAISCGKKEQAQVEEKPVPVTIMPASFSTLSVGRTYTGTLEGWRQARIYASIPEAVIELPVREGNEVQAGQAVIVLDKGGPASQMTQAQAVFAEAQDNFEKMSRLYEQGAISQQAYNNAKTNLDVARANYQSARQQVELTSPISGVLTDLTVNVGQYVPVGSPLATVAQTDKMRMNIYVDNRSVASLQVGQKAQISVAGYEGAGSEFTGTVTEVARSADPETRLFRVELQIDNSQRLLSPGMFARAAIAVQQIDSALTVPREAVFTSEGIAKVYIVNDSRAKEKSIELGEATLDKYQVISGLNPGEKVIVLGRSLVEDGSLVKIVEEDSTVAPAAVQEGVEEG